MAKDPVEEALEKADGKRAKVKTLDTLPTDTKVTKLPPALLKSIGEAFAKAKLKQVRLHTGKEAMQACKSVGAKAFASGTDIYLSKPGYAKDTGLLAHELSHVIQYGKGKIMPAKKGKVLTTK